MHDIHHEPVITPPPAINQGPFEPRPAGAPTPEEAPYRYLFGYAAKRDRVEVSGNVEMFLPGLVRSQDHLDYVRRVIADQINRINTASAVPYYSPDDVSFTMIHLLAKEA